VSVELIYDQHDSRGLGVVEIDHVPDAVCPVKAGALIANPDLQPPGHQDVVDDPDGGILRIMASRLDRARRQRGRTSPSGWPLVSSGQTTGRAESAGRW
jgi:hypothetical protein